MYQVYMYHHILLRASQLVPVRRLRNTSRRSIICESSQSHGLRALLPQHVFGTISHSSALGSHDLTPYVTLTPSFGLGVAHCIPWQSWDFLSLPTTRLRIFIVVRPGGHTEKKNKNNRLLFFLVSARWRGIQKTKQNTNLEKEIAFFFFIRPKLSAFQFLFLVLTLGRSVPVARFLWLVAWTLGVADPSFSVNRSSRFFSGQGIPCVK